MELDILKIYILCENDMAIPSAWQESLAVVGGFDKVYRVASGHAPFRKVPEKIVEIIQETAAAATIAADQCG
jgi:hypothetical protein